MHILCVREVFYADDSVAHTDYLPDAGRNHAHHGQAPAGRAGSIRTGHDSAFVRGGVPAHHQSGHPACLRHRARPDADVTGGSALRTAAAYSGAQESAVGASHHTDPARQAGCRRHEKKPHIGGGAVLPSASEGGVRPGSGGVRHRRAERTTLGCSARHRAAGNHAGTGHRSARAGHHAPDYS